MNIGLNAHNLVVDLGLMAHNCSSPVVAAVQHLAREQGHQHEDQVPEHLAHALHKNRNYSHHEEVAFGPNQSQNHSVEEPPVGVLGDNRTKEDTEDSERGMALLAAADSHSPSSAEKNKENRAVDPTELVVLRVFDKMAEDNHQRHVMALEATKTKLCRN